MNFGSLASKAGEFAEKQMGGNKASTNEQAASNSTSQSAGDASATAGSADNTSSTGAGGAGGSKWENVGSQASKAYTDFQSNRAAGKPVDYSGLGAVGKDAYAAYGAEGGQKDDLTNLGKGLASGFGSKGGQAQEKQ
ncbi:hypothetical protein BROUX41_004463 [Berkeleyomyces rouxiae]|uniref:uncharacterized protein n=1 Tax=Berkeleyomyces rouxiae TaxID=2035830 RepID=UPI003B7DEF99